VRLKLETALRQSTTLIVRCDWTIKIWRAEEHAAGGETSRLKHAQAFCVVASSSEVVLSSCLSNRSNLYTFAIPLSDVILPPKDLAGIIAINVMGLN